MTRFGIDTRLALLAVAVLVLLCTSACVRATAGNDTIATLETMAASIGEPVEGAVVEVVDSARLEPWVE